MVASVAILRLVIANTYMDRNITRIWKFYRYINLIFKKIIKASEKKI